VAYGTIEPRVADALLYQGKKVGRDHLCKLWKSRCRVNTFGYNYTQVVWQLIRKWFFYIDVYR